MGNQQKKANCLLKWLSNPGKEHCYAKEKMFTAKIMDWRILVLKKT